MLRIFFISLFAITFTCTLRAQEGWELGGHIGAAHYFGDLNTNFSLTDIGAHASAMARYNFSDRWSSRLKVGYARVAANDNDSPNVYERARNLHFRSNIVEASLDLEFNFLKYIHGSKDNYFTPYIFGGLAFSNFKPEAKLDETWVSLRDYGTEGQFLGDEYYNTSFALDYGIGFKYDLSYEWSLNIEANVHQLFTDYLDDVSGRYPDMEDLKDIRGEDAVRLSDRSIIIEGVNTQLLGEEGRLRGNASDKDLYATLSIGLMYYFGDLKCPTYGSK